MASATPAAPEAPVEDALTLALAAIRAKQASLTTDRQEAQDRLRALDAELKQLGIAERALDTEAPARPRPATSTDRVHAFMLQQGEATMAEVAAAIERPKNTAKHGLVKMEAAGLIERTGELRDRSPVFRVIKAA